MPFAIGSQPMARRPIQPSPGAITSTSHSPARGPVAPSSIGIYRAWKAGDYDKARELQFSILLLIRAMFAAPFPVGFKTALEVRGFKMGPPQQPLSDAEYFKFAGTRNRIEKIMVPILKSLSAL